MCTSSSFRLPVKKSFADQSSRHTWAVLGRPTFSMSAGAFHESSSDLEGLYGDSSSGESDGLDRKLPAPVSSEVTGGDTSRKWKGRNSVDWRRWNSVDQGQISRERSQALGPARKYCRSVQGLTPHRALIGNRFYNAAPALNTRWPGFVRRLKNTVGLWSAGELCDSRDPISVDEYTWGERRPTRATGQYPQ